MNEKKKIKKELSIEETKILEIESKIDEVIFTLKKNIREYGIKEISYLNGNIYKVKKMFELFAEVEILISHMSDDKFSDIKEEFECVTKKIEE